MEIDQDLQTFVNHLSEEEKGVLAQVVAGFEKRNHYQYDYMAGMLGIEGGMFDGDDFVLEMPIATLSNNRFGMTHGGLIATLADNAMGYMLNQTLIKEGKFAVTSDLQIRYLRPGKGEKLIAKARVVKKGQTIVVTECDVYNEKNVHIATVTATFYIAKQKERP